MEVHHHTTSKKSSHLRVRRKDKPLFEIDPEVSITSTTAFCDMDNGDKKKKFKMSIMWIVFAILIAGFIFIGVEMFRNMPKEDFRNGEEEEKSGSAAPSEGLKEPSGPPHFDRDSDVLMDAERGSDYRKEPPKQAEQVYEGSMPSADQWQESNSQEEYIPQETATDPPYVEPPATDPPYVEPPATEAPYVEPPGPATEAPYVEPPVVTDPPYVEPPAATEPPYVEPVREEYQEPVQEQYKEPVQEQYKEEPYQEQPVGSQDYQQGSDYRDDTQPAENSEYQDTQQGYRAEDQYQQQDTGEHAQTGYPAQQESVQQEYTGQQSGTRQEEYVESKQEDYQEPVRQTEEYVQQDYQEPIKEYVDSPIDGGVNTENSANTIPAEAIQDNQETFKEATQAESVNEYDQGGTQEFRQAETKETIQQDKGIYRQDADQGNYQQEQHQDIREETFKDNVEYNTQDNYEDIKSDRVAEPVYNDQQNQEAVRQETDTGIRDQQ